MAAIVGRDGPVRDLVLHESYTTENNPFGAVPRCGQCVVIMDDILCQK